MDTYNDKVIKMAPITFTIYNFPFSGLGSCTSQAASRVKV